MNGLLGPFGILIIYEALTCQCNHIIEVWLVDRETLKILEEE